MYTENPHHGHCRQPHVAVIVRKEADGHGLVHVLHGAALCTPAPRSHMRLRQQHHSSNGLHWGGWQLSGKLTLRMKVMMDSSAAVRTRASRS